jgi:hypothetical protein
MPFNDYLARDLNIETFEFLLKFGKSSYRRKPVSSFLLVPGFRRDDVWTPAPVPDSDPGFAGVTIRVDFQRSRNSKVSQ